MVRFKNRYILGELVLYNNIMEDEVSEKEFLNVTTTIAK